MHSVKLTYDFVLRLIIRLKYTIATSSLNRYLHNFKKVVEMNRSF